LAAFRLVSLPWTIAALSAQLSLPAESALFALLKNFREPSFAEMRLALTNSVLVAVSGSNNGPLAPAVIAQISNAVFGLAGPVAFTDTMAAFSADAEVLDAGYSPLTLATSQLWPGRIPDWVIKYWEQMKGPLLAAAEDWIVWTDWYEERLKGRQSSPALDLDRANIPDDTWAEGPAVVNNLIRQMHEERGIMRYELSDSGADAKTELETRLVALPVDKVAIVGARAALRAIPLFNFGSATELLSVLRIASAAWAAAIFPSSSLGAAIKVRAHDRATKSQSDVARSAAYVMAASLVDEMNLTAAQTVDIAVSELRSASAARDGIAAGTVFSMAITDDLNDTETATSRSVGVLPFWSGGAQPEWLVKRWEVLKQDLIGVGHGWEVWVQWYEDRLHGRVRSEAYEHAYVDVPEEMWDEPVRVNTWILKRLGELDTAATGIPEIPSPGPGPRFGIREDGPIDHISHAEIDEQGNDLKTINQLKPLVQRCVSDLEARLSRNEFPELLTTVGQYRTALAPDAGRAIEWGEVWGLGVMLQNAATSAERQIALRTLPPLEDPAKTALDSILALHGPLVLATREGAELSASAHVFTMTREETARLRAASEQLAEQLAARPDVITPSAAGSVSKAVDAIGEGRHPERGSVYALATIKNVAVVLIGGAAVATPTVIGTLLGYPLLGTMLGSPISLLGVEAIKKNAAFVALASRLGAHLDTMSNVEISVWVERRARDLAPFRSFVITNEAPLRKIAESTNELKWMVRYIDFLVAKDV
jgi:hypothetical protein